MYKLLLIFLFLCLTVAPGCTDNSGPEQTPSPEESAKTTAPATPAIEVPTVTVEPTETPTTGPTKTSTTEPLETTTTEPAETTTTEPVETTATEPAETATTEPTSTLPETRLYKNDDFYYQMSIPYSSRINKEDNYNVFISGAVGEIYIHIDRLTVDESAEAYFNSILEGENEKITHLISEPDTETTENDVIIGYEFDCSNPADGDDNIGRGIVLKKGNYGFFVSFTSAEDGWEENKEIILECLASFTLPPIYTGSYTNSELGISLVLPANWSLIDTGSKSAPVKISCCTGNYIERFDMSWMQSVSGELLIKTVEPGTTAEEYLAMKSSGATQTPFTFTNSAVGSEYSMALRANDEVIAEFKYVALVIGNKVYYFEFISVPDMSTLEDSVTEVVRSLVVSTQ